MSRSVTLTGRVVVLALSVLTVGCALSPPVQIVPLVDQSAVAELPEWQIGDRWVFRWQQGFGEGRFTRVVEDAAPGGYTLLTVELGRRSYLAPDGAIIAEVQDDIIVSQHVPPLLLVKFPLRAGSKWVQGGGAILPGAT